jgi:hypothetical protein
MVRDIDGKYSFTVLSPPSGQEIHLELKCKVKRVEIRLARTTLP